MMARAEVLNAFGNVNADSYELYYVGGDTDRSYRIHRSEFGGTLKALKNPALKEPQVYPDTVDRNGTLSRIESHYCHSALLASDAM